MQSVCNEKLVKLVKVDTKDNLTDLGTKLLDPDTFEQLKDQMMVHHPIPAFILEVDSSGNPTPTVASTDASESMASATATGATAGTSSVRTAEMVQALTGVPMAIPTRALTSLASTRGVVMRPGRAVLA